MAPYCASKYAMLGFSESLLHELHGTGVENNGSESDRRKN